jgi:hypothetical protein
MIERARRWVSFWDAVEHPRTLGLVRVMFAFVVLYDFAELWVTAWWCRCSARKRQEGGRT